MPSAFLVPRITQSSRPHSILGVILLPIVLLAALTRAAPDENPVCIVGAGPAGLSAAHSLEAKGKQVVVFEKQAQVGGKCQAYYENDTFHPLGALLFTNTTYRETLNIISTTNVTAVEFDDGQPTWDYDWTNGTIFAAPAPTLTFEALLAAEAARYVAWWTLEFAPNMVSIGYKNGVPQEFTVSTSDWLAQSNYFALPVIFNLGMVAYGYGDLRQTPILYMLQYFSPDVLLSFAGVTPGYLIDFHEVFVQFATNSIQGPILTNTSVTNIDRSGLLPILTYTNSSAPGTQTCSSVILAFPPTLSALQSAGLTLTANETEVFSRVGITNYFSGAVRLSQVPSHQLYYASSPSPALPPDADAEPVAFLSLHNNSDIATTWSWGEYGGNYTVEQGRELLKEVLSELNRDPSDPSATATPVSDADIKAFWKPDYFPHFDEAELAGGWYEKLAKLQGEQNTYWASGLNGFETVEFAVRAGLNVVDSYF